MSKYASTAVNLAKSYVGYYGKKSNSNLDDFTANKGGKYTKFAYDFDTKYPTFYNGRKNGYDWCDVFFDWLMVTSFGETIGREMTYQPLKSCGAGCGYSAGYYKANKRFFTYPKVGDQIFFGNSTSTYHTGIVVAVDNTYVYTVEGNIGNPCHVGEKKYKLGSSRIKGYGRPNYDEEPVEKPTKTNILFAVVSGEVRYKTTTANLALRSKAQTTNGKRFFYIPKGSKVKLVQEAICVEDGYEWDCVIATYGGKEWIGYCANKWLK